MKEKKRNKRKESKGQIKSPFLSDKMLERTLGGEAPDDDGFLLTLAALFQAGLDPVTDKACGKANEP